jgi:hypothetical protein
VVSILSKRYLIMFNHEVRTQGTVLRALTTFITSVPFTKCKDFPSETRERRCLMPIMLLLAPLLLHYRILAKLTVLMNTIEGPLLLIQGEVLSLITRQAPPARMNNRPPSSSEIHHFHNTSVGARTFCFSYTLICLRKYISLSQAFLFPVAISCL